MGSLSLFRDRLPQFWIGWSTPDVDVPQCCHPVKIGVKFLVGTDICSRDVLIFTHVNNLVEEVNGKLSHYEAVVR